jgi:hypothetical protein
MAATAQGKRIYTVQANGGSFDKLKTLASAG